MLDFRDVREGELTHLRHAKDIFCLKTKLYMPVERGEIFLVLKNYDSVIYACNARFVCLYDNNLFVVHEADLEKLL